MGPARLPTVTTTRHLYRSPERTATITTNVLEFLIAMGLQDKVIGTQAAAAGAYPADIQAVADTIPKLGGEYVPGAFVPVQKEDLLAADPDFVIGGWPSNFDTSLGAFSQDELNERDINNYFSVTALCNRTAPVNDVSVVTRISKISAPSSRPKRPPPI